LFAPWAQTRKPEKKGDPGGKANAISEGHQFNRRHCIQKPTEIYLNTAELLRYFSGVQEVWFLHDEYTSSDVDIDVWHDLGVSRLPRKLPTSEGLPYGEREYSTRSETIENYDLDGLEQFLEAIQEITDFEEQKSSASVLWGFLRDYLELDASLFQSQVSVVLLQLAEQIFQFHDPCSAEKLKMGPYKR